MTTVVQLIGEIQESIKDAGASWGDFRVAGSDFDYFGRTFEATHGLSKTQANNIIRNAANSNGLLLNELLASHGIADCLATK